jgi:hypothetical protein
MPHYQSLIDGTDYRTLLAYLHHPQSSIHYVLHVRTLPALIELAEKLDHPINSAPLTPAHAAEILRVYADRGLLKVTCRHPHAFPQPSALVPASAIDGETKCSVLYLPPFYLSLTEGLFESVRTNVSQEPVRERGAEVAQKIGLRLKF